MMTTRECDMVMFSVTSLCNAVSGLPLIEGVSLDTSELLF